MESYLASSACVGFLRDVNLTCVEGSWWAALEVAVVCPRTRYITGLMWSPLWFVLCALHKPRMWKASHFFPRFLQFLFPTKVWDCADIWCPHGALAERPSSSPSLFQLGTERWCFLPGAPWVSRHRCLRRSSRRVTAGLDWAGSIFYCGWTSEHPLLLS